MATLVFVVHLTALVTAAVLLWACLVGASRYRAEHSEKQHALATTTPKPKTAAVRPRRAALTATHRNAVPELRALSAHR